MVFNATINNISVYQLVLKITRMQDTEFYMSPDKTTLYWKQNVYYIIVL